MDNLEIRNKLIDLADEKYKNFHSNLCPGTNNILGVRVPILRKLAKELVKEDFNKYLGNAKSDYYEEVMLQGMVIGLAKTNIEHMCKYLKEFIPKIDNWAICDVTCAGLKITNNNMEYMWKFLKTYLKSNKEFELRFAIVMLLDFYLIDNYIDEVLEILNNVKHEGYYVKMAVAWTISIAFIRYPEKTLRFLKNNNLDKFTYNKSLQKIIESYRVDDSMKQKIRLMKKI